MKSDEQLRLIDRFYNDMWNRFDKSVFGDILDPKIHFRGSLGQTKVGFDEFGEYVDGIQAFASDFHNECSGWHRPVSDLNTPGLRCSRSPTA